MILSAFDLRQLQDCAALLALGKEAGLSLDEVAAEVARTINEAVGRSEVIHASGKAETRSCPDCGKPMRREAKEIIPRRPELVWNCINCGRSQYIGAVEAV